MQYASALLPNPLAASHKGKTQHYLQNTSETSGHARPEVFRYRQPVLRAVFAESGIAGRRHRVCADIVLANAGMRSRSDSPGSNHDPIVKADRSLADAREARLDFDLGAKLDDLPGRQSKKCRGAFSVALQEREHRFPPHPHARNVLAWDDRLAPDVIGDVGEIDARQLGLPAGEHEALVDGRILHEAVVQDDARDTRGNLDD